MFLYLLLQDGFSVDDVAFLVDNGFNVVCVGVIWVGVELQFGVYDDVYFDGIVVIVQTLVDYGIGLLFDFYQDMYNECFQGEGVLVWVIDDGGLLNLMFGFFGNYFGNFVQEHVWDGFWRNVLVSDGIGLQDHYVWVWVYVVVRFCDMLLVVGYEVMNELWLGIVWE